MFVPFERPAALHDAQHTFRRGWAIDQLTGVVNGRLLSAALVAALGAVDGAAAASLS